MYPLAPLLALALAGCGGTETIVGGTPDDSGASDDTGGGPTPMDQDGDGSWTPEDCNDYDAGIHPGAVEVCDGLDNDCNGIVDVNDAIDTTTWYQDGDGDGHGDPGRTVDACNQPPGFVLTGEDCDDADATTHPDADEICNDGADNNCNGDASECTLEGELSLAAAGGAWSGVSGADNAGWAVAGAGDVDGDGLDDVLVGAPYSDAGGSNAGAVYLLRGPAKGTGSLAAAHATWRGTASSENAGMAVAGVGDVNADGYDDLLIGSYHADLNGSDSGGAYLVLGPTSGSHALAGEADAVLEGEESNDYAGLGVGGGWDHTGDGVVDLLIGASGQGEGSAQSHGRVYVVSGAVSGAFDLAKAEATIDGTQSYDRASVVASVGDTDGDGVADVVVGAYDWPNNDGTGGVFLYTGPLAGALTLDDAAATLSGEQEEDQAGWAVAAAGDVDGDGRADVVVGAPEADGGGTEAGVAYVLWGPLASGSLAGADTRIAGTDDRANLGYAVAGGGDVDDDGRADVLIGAVAADTVGTDAGGAWLYYAPSAGALTEVDADLALPGVAARDEAGASVALVGNLDGDCCGDFAVGALESDGGGSGSGGVYLLYGVGE